MNQPVAWMKGVAVAAFLALAVHPPLRAQQTAAPSFEAASVKPNKAGGPSSVRATPGGMLAVTNNTLANIVRNAYGLQMMQIVGGPAWMSSDHWDITAKAASPFAQPEGMAMLRALLADRFKLAAHRETREMPV